MKEIKNCQTCAYLINNTCSRSGFHWEVARQLSYNFEWCNVKFSGWVSKNPESVKNDKQTPLEWLRKTFFRKN